MDTPNYKSSNEKLNLYIDLDGTILDISEKYYRIYSDTIISLGYDLLSKEKYWQLKKEKRQEEDIAKMSGINETAIFKYYNKEWQSKIESLKYLEYDKLIPNAVKTLKNLKKFNRIVLVTLRKSQINLYKELERLNIVSLFDGILIGKGAGEQWEIKAKLVESDNTFEKKKSVIIGDTEVDIRAGKKLGIKTIAVLSGIRRKSMLLVERPDYIINNINKLPIIIKQIQAKEEEK